MKTALYLGRFQPFHNGHLKLINDIYDNYGKIVIAICSAQVENTRRNPLSYVERLFMIRHTLREEGFDINKFRFIPIPDINFPEKWAKFCNCIFGDYDIVITNNDNTRKLFEERGDEVMGTKNFRNMSGSQIRKMIFKFNNMWKKLVPRFVRICLLNEGLLDKIRTAYLTGKCEICKVKELTLQTYNSKDKGYIAICEYCRKVEELAGEDID